MRSHGLLRRLRSGTWELWALLQLPQPVLFLEMLLLQGFSNASQLDQAT